MSLRACPFCREMFLPGEAEKCPECGLALRDPTSLPPSPEALTLLHEETKAAPVPVLEHEPLPWRDFGRGRGVLILCGLIGAVAFHLPWAIQTTPQTITWSGAEMARTAPFYWLVFSVWLVLVPAALSRRTEAKMLGARAVLAVLSILPALCCAFLWSRPSRLVVRGLAFEYHWGHGFHTTWIVSVLATFTALRFGVGRQVHDHDR